MPITFHCACGKTLRVNDELGGKKARCPACQAVVDIPAPAADPGFEVVEDDAPPPQPAKPLLARPVARPPSKPAAPPPPDEKSDPDDGDEGGAYKAKKGSSARRVEEDHAEERRKARRRNRSDRDDEYDDEDEFDRAERRRVTGGGKRRPDPMKRYMFIAGGVLALLIGCGIMWFYKDSDDQVRGKFGRKRSVFGIGVALTIAGVVCAGAGAMGYTPRDDE